MPSRFFNLQANCENPVGAILNVVMLSVDKVNFMRIRSLIRFSKERYLNDMSYSYNLQLPIVSYFVSSVSSNGEVVFITSYLYCLQFGKHPRKFIFVRILTFLGLFLLFCLVYLLLPYPIDY